MSAPPVRPPAGPAEPEGRAAVGGSTGPAPATVEDVARRALCPRIRQVWQYSALAATVVIGVAGGAVTSLLDGTAQTALAAITAALFVGGLVVTFAVVPVRYRRWSYALGPAALELSHGVVTHRSSTVPYVRVQHIDLTAGPLDRRLDLTTLVIRTASATTDARLPGIDGEEAERLRATILRRAGLEDAV